jgi:hypothetical protein
VAAAFEHRSSRAGDPLHVRFIRGHVEAAILDAEESRTR